MNKLFFAHSQKKKLRHPLAYDNRVMIFLQFAARPTRPAARPLGGWMAAGGRGTTRWVCLLHFFSLTRPFGRQASSPRYYKCYMKLALFNVTFKPPYTVFRNIFSSVSIKYSKDQSIWLESEPVSSTRGGTEDHKLNLWAFKRQEQILGNVYTLPSMLILAG